MSVKRQATTELNHDNWDQEEPDDEQDGSEGFKIASKDILEKRVIRTAKRRSQISGDETKKSVFSGFSGFNKSQPSSFDFLSNLTNGNKANSVPAKTETGMTFGIAGAKPLGTNSPGTFSTFGTPKATTEVSSDSPFGVASTKASPINPIKSVFNTSATESKTDNPFNIQTTSSSAFASFSPKTANTTPAASSIFGATTTPATNSAKTTSNNSSPFKIQSSQQPVQTSNAKPSEPEEKKEDEEQAKQVYYSKLERLNVSVSDWIKQHVEKTPLCILSPIFKDYEKYLDEIQTEYENSKAENKEPPAPVTTTSENNSASTFTSNSTSTFANNSASTFANNSASPLTNNSALTLTNNSPKSIFSSTTNNLLNTGAKPSNFSFGINTNSSTNTLSSLSTANTGLFGAKPAQESNLASTAPSNGNAPFSFGIGKPFSFNSNVKQNNEEVKKDEEAEDEPPKVEFTPVVEENSVFDKKCKVFIKKDGAFVDKGVGTLYVKKIEDSGKHQLLVRANTNLGTILLNFILSSSVPIQRMGKNNVMVACIPTPDSKPPPIPVLIRVKTSEEADNLLEELEKYKA